MAERVKYIPPDFDDSENMDKANDVAPCHIPKKRIKRFFDFACSYNWRHIVYFSSWISSKANFIAQYCKYYKF
jgi:hypothetical protein